VALAALLIGLFMGAIGLLAVVAPHGLLTAARSLQTPLGICLIAATRVLFGVVLVLAAPSSRAPKALRVFGFMIVVAGVITPFFGVDRARAILDWWSGQGALVMRAWAGVAIAFGAFVVYAVAPRRHAA
jgi:hypothetical protein